MVQLCGDDRVVYMVLEGDRPIGRVVAPAGEPMLGPGAETVLLQRGNGAGVRAEPAG